MSNNSQHIQNQQLPHQDPQSLPHKTFSVQAINLSTIFKLSLSMLPTTPTTSSLYTILMSQPSNTSRSHLLSPP